MHLQNSPSSHLEFLTLCIKPLFVSNYLKKIMHFFNPFLPVHRTHCKIKSQKSRLIVEQLFENQLKLDRKIENKQELNNIQYIKIVVKNFWDSTGIKKIRTKLTISKRWRASLNIFQQSKCKWVHIIKHFMWAQH